MKYQFMRKQTTDSFAIRIVMLIVACLFLLLPASAVGQEKDTSEALSQIPKYILESSELESGVCKVHAKCIDADYNDVKAPFSELVTFKWGIKYQGQDISWVETDKSHIILHLQSQDEDVNVFLEVIDKVGSKGVLHHTIIRANAQNVYTSDENNLFIDAQGKLYTENRKPWYYDFGRIYIDYTPDIAYEYKGREWMPITAHVQSPSGANYTISVDDRGVLIKDVLPSCEMEWITANAEDGKTVIYLIALDNFNSLLIQYIPVYFTYQTKIVSDED